MDLPTALEIYNLVEHFFATNFTVMFRKIVLNFP